MPTWVLALVLSAGAFLGLIFLSLLGDEIKGWVGVLPFGILWAASLRIPAESRAQLYSEWKGDLAAELADKEERPLTRLGLGIGFAVGLVRGGRRQALERSVTPVDGRVAISAKMLAGALLVDVAFFFYGMLSYTGSNTTVETWRAAIFLVMIVATGSMIWRWFRQHARPTGRDERPTG